MLLNIPLLKEDFYQLILCHFITFSQQALISIPSVKGDVGGDVKTGSGDVQCGNVDGDVSTGSGNVQCGDVRGRVSTGMGNIYRK